MLASPWKDALVILVIVLLFFGPKRLPALSRSIGESIREFKGGITESTSSAEKSGDEKTEIPAGASETASTSTTSEHTNA